MKAFVARTADQWRTWLDEHHDSEPEVWLVFYKRHTGAGSIAYSDALDEALCFGWVDSLVKRLDDSCYARKFTPRKADSRWSAINRRRYAAWRRARFNLIAAGAQVGKGIGSICICIGLLRRAQVSAAQRDRDVTETAQAQSVLNAAGDLPVAVIPLPEKPDGVGRS